MIGDRARLDGEKVRLICGSFLFRGGEVETIWNVVLPFWEGSGKFCCWKNGWRCNEKGVA